MTDLELAAELKALRESVERVRKTVACLAYSFEDFTMVLTAEAAPRDAAAAGFERYRARLKAREART